jgi:hypothetical protein
MLGKPRREVLIGALLTAAVAGLLLAFGPAPGDAPAHLYRTLLVRQGTFVWDNFWYAGNFPLASYSLLYYLPAAVVGNLPLVVAASVASTVLFASIAFREWGETALWPTRIFGILAAAPVFTGLYAYALGFSALLGAIKALQAGRPRLAALLAALTLGFSPLAFAFLCLVLLALALGRARPFSRRSLWIAAAIAFLCGGELTIQALFPSPGIYPFHAIDLAGVLLVSTLGALLARRARGGAPFQAFFLLWGLGSIVAFFVATPLGGNWTRLGAFGFPLMLLTAGLAGFRPRKLVFAALTVALAYNVIPFALLVPYRLDGRPAKAAFWQPALGFLRAHSGPNYRIEVVPTSAHWESYWLPRSGFALARGWYRQLDVVDNPILYEKSIDPVEYRAWLRSVAAKYVLVPSTQLDPVGGPKEARLVASPQSGLKVAFRSKDWTIYRLPHARPLLTGPGRADVVRFGHSVIAGHVSAPGRYLLRARFVPYWKLHGAGCASPGPGKMTWLDLRAAGWFSLSVAETPAALYAVASSSRAATC